MNKIVEGMERIWREYIMKNINRVDGENIKDIERIFQRKMNKELFKLKLGSWGNSFLLYISYRNILNRIRRNKNNEI